MPVFCPACDASNRRGAGSCSSCGQPLTTRAATSSGRQPVTTPTAPRGSLSATQRRRRRPERGLGPIVWISIAVLVLCAGLGIYFATGLSSSQNKGGKNDTAVDPVDSLKPRVAAFEAAWARSDKQAIGAFYPPRSPRKLRRLPARFARRGWRDQLPELGEAEWQDGGGPQVGKEVVFPIEFGEVRTVWKHENGQWFMVQLILPSTLGRSMRGRLPRLLRRSSQWSARESTGEPQTEPDAPDESGAAPATASVACELRPILRLRIESEQSVMDIPAMQVTGRVLRDHMGKLGGDKLLDHFDGLWSSIRWPVEVDCAIPDPQRMVIVVRISSRERVVIPWMETNAGAKQPVRTVGGVRYSYLPFFFGGTRVYEGVVDGVDHVVFLKGPERDDNAWLRTIAKGTVAMDPKAKRLWARTSAGNIRMLFSLDAVVHSSRTPESAKARAMLRTFVGSMSSVTVHGGRQQDRYIIDMFTDLCAGSGLIGGLFKAEKQPSRLTGWVPESAPEFATLSFDVDAVEKLLLGPTGAAMSQTLEALEIPATPREAASFVAEHLDGELAYFGPPSTAETALDPDAEEPAVFLLRVVDSAALLAKIRGWAGGGEDALPRAPDVGTDVYTLMGKDGQPLFYFASRPQVLIIGFGDKESRGLLRASLTTRGKSRLPAAFRKRVGPTPPAADMLFLSSRISDYAGRVAMKDLAGRGPTPSQRHMGGEVLRRLQTVANPKFAGWLTVGRDGTRMRSIY